MIETTISYLKKLLETNQYTAIKHILTTINPADAALLFEEMFEGNYDEKEFVLCFRLLPKDLAADTFAYMNPEMQKNLISTFSDKELREVLSQSFVDDTVDMIEEMPANVVARILRNSNPDTRKAINEILKYPEDSAGSIMTIEYVSLRKEMTVEEAFVRIRRVGVNKETIYTCYVTENRKLIGLITVKDLLIAEADCKIEDIMETHLIWVHTHEDKEVVANMFNKYDFLAMPVVDNEQRLVGIVTFDDAIDVIQEENTEDFSKMAAMEPIEDSYFRTSVFKHAKKRIVWLLVLMLSATLTGALITHYEEAFAAIPLLVSFIPMLMDTGGNCGSQSSTLIIRGLALDEIKFRDIFRVIFKELRISLVVSSALAFVNAVRIYLMYDHNIALAIVIGLSLIGTVVLAELVGCVLPLLAKKCRVDPAIMAAPLITTLVDTCSIFIYFNIAMRVFQLA